MCHVSWISGETSRRGFSVSQYFVVETMSSHDTDVYGFPKSTGLYSAELEKDACGVGFIVNINGLKNNEVYWESVSCFRAVRHGALFTFCSFNIYYNVTIEC